MHNPRPGIIPREPWRRRGGRGCSGRTRRRVGVAAATPAALLLASTGGRGWRVRGRRAWCWRSWRSAEASGETDVEGGVGRLPSGVTETLFLHAKLCDRLRVRQRDEGEVGGGLAKVGVEAAEEVGEEDGVVDGHADIA